MIHLLPNPAACVLGRVFGREKIREKTWRGRFTKYQVVMQDEEVIIGFEPLEGQVQPVIDAIGN